MKAVLQKLKRKPKPQKNMRSSKILQGKFSRPPQPVRKLPVNYTQIQKGSPTERLAEVICDPFAHSDDEARWALPYTLYPTRAYQNRGNVALTLTASTTYVGASVFQVRGDAVGTLLYNYTLTGSPATVTDWATAGVSLHLGHNSGYYFERPTGVGFRLKFSCPGTYHRIKLMLCPSAAITTTGSIPTDCSLPLTAAQRDYGCFSVSLEPGDAIQFAAVPLDSRGTDMMVSNVSRGAAGWTYCNGLVYGTNTGDVVEVETIYRSEYISTGAATDTSSAIMVPPDGAGIDRVFGKIANWVTSGLNCVLLKGGTVVESVLENAGRSALGWLGLAQAATVCARQRLPLLIAPPLAQFTASTGNSNPSFIASRDTLDEEKEMVLVPRARPLQTPH